MIARVASILLICGTAFLPGCYERVVYRAPGLLDGALRNNPNLEMIAPDPSGVGRQAPDVGWESMLTASPAELDATPDENDSLRLTTRNGDTILVRRAPSHLVHHLINTIRDEEWELLYDQLLSDRLLRSYVEQGRDPRESLTFIQDNRRAILELLRSIPAGEATPGATLHVRGAGRFRIVRAGGYRGDGKFWAIEIVIERRRVALSMLHRKAPRDMRRW